MNAPAEPRSRQIWMRVD